MRIIERLRNLLGQFRLFRKLRSLDNRLDSLESQRDHVIKDLQKRRDSLETLQNTVASEVEALATSVLRTDKLVKRYETELVAVRAQLRVAEESTIPALVASNKVLLARWEAETAIQVRRQVAASVVEDRGM